MCVGIPMQIISLESGGALCDWRGEKRLINTLLISDPQPGQWVLTFLDQAREILSEAQAQQIQQALEALELVANGDHNVDHLFADLVDREPQLPDFLKPEFEKKQQEQS